MNYRKAGQPARLPSYSISKKKANLTADIEASSPKDLSTQIEPVSGDDYKNFLRLSLAKLNQTKLKPAPSPSPVASALDIANNKPLELPAPKVEEKKNPSMTIKRYKWETSHNMLRMKSSTAIDAIMSKKLTSRFEFKKLIGEGSYGVVRLAVDKTTGMEVAVKMYEKYKLFDKQRVFAIQREVSILQKLNHKNIIKLYDYYEDERVILLVLEYVKGESLTQRIKNEDQPELEENDIKYFVGQLADALNYIHSMGIAHRDIKLDNILVDDNGYIKLIDFGFSVPIHQLNEAKQANNPTKIICGTPYYMAPELLDAERVSLSPDIWALGVLTYYLIFGNYPFKGDNNTKLFAQIRNCLLYTSPSPRDS
eukprot:TRINITY_DN3111_c0_g1_i9.p1 TRINITY_DN3111_c0_g1~~TRINITY_DN3111_c0_g1_i9.p1  ORF type:complete len:367 (+),score=74.51 TRINITY_DN3111_c0_g1_i9:25-1125(+)